MPSQRLLEILDPWGHVGERRVLARTAPTAIGSWPVGSPPPTLGEP